MTNVASPPKRIVLVTGHVDRGGVQEVVCNLARELPRFGREPTVVLLGEGASPDRFAERFGVDRRMVADVPLPRLRGFSAWRDRRLWRGVFDAIGAGVVNLHHSHASGLSAAELSAMRSGGRRLAVSLHGIDLPATMTLRRRLSVLRSWRHCDVVMATTPAMVENLRAWRVGVEAQLVPLGVRAPKRRDTDEARRQLGIAADERVVCHVARAHWTKGAGVLARVVRRLNEQGEKVRLLIGWATGGDEADLDAEVRRELGDAVTIRLDEPDLGLLYSAGDLHVLPSVEESFGLVLVEAAFCGVPSLVYDSAGARHAVAHGETGEVVANGDERALGESIRRLMKDRVTLERYGAAAERFALERHSFDDFVRGYLGVLDKLAPDKRFDALAASWAPGAARAGGS